ncbi:MAG: 16S rRNA (cytidine(1402)-2'-O)-methyltransferase [Bryobacteraceae bacterium]|nr:16S rRNA (cytidine(1402)-2'-O)-methyltransferase [Bryobacteraceae bacterium]
MATPIGNLEDMTYRAVRVLGEVGMIACEDTRQTRKLLDRYGIHTPLVSYHEHNERERTAQLIARLKEGAAVALVSDAGTPLVSDPGFRLVETAAAEGIRVEPIPGPSAMMAALSASGLPTDAVWFGGFLPAKSGQRRKALEAVRDLEATLVFYEAPHRILELLADIEEVLGGRRVVAARELTKVHEEFVRGRVSQVRAALAARDTVRGEFTVLVAKSDGPAAGPAGPAEDAVAALERAGIDRMDAIKQVARERGLPKREVYRLVELRNRSGRSTESDGSPKQK